MNKRELAVKGIIVSELNYDVVELIIDEERNLIRISVAVTGDVDNKYGGLKFTEEKVLVTHLDFDIFSNMLDLNLPIAMTHLHNSILYKN